MTRRIFLGCLRCYNEGRIIGKWLDLNDYSYEEMEEQAKKIVEESPCIGGEEYEIQDSEGFNSLLSNNSSIREAYMLHEAFEEVESKGIDLDLWMEFLELEASQQEILKGNGEELIERFEDKYAGEFDSLQDWAYQFMQDTYFSSSNTPDILERYFDYEAYGRDCELSGDIYSIRHKGKVHIFNANC